MLQRLRVWRANRLYQRALSLLDDDEPDRALALGEKLLRLKYSGGYEILALAHQQRGELDKAVEVLERGVERCPSVWLLWQLLGNLRDDLGKREQALETYDRALACPDVRSGSVRFNRSITLSRLQRHAEALEELDRIEDAMLDPTLRTRVLGHRVDCLCALGRAAEAVAATEAALARLSAEEDARSPLLAEVGLARLRAKDEPGARKALEELVEIGGPGGRWLQLARALDGKPLEKGFEFHLIVTGRATFPLPDGTPAGFLRCWVIAAADPASALQWAARLEPESLRAGLEIDECEALRPVEPGTLDGPYGGAGGHLFFPLDDKR